MKLLQVSKADVLGGAERIAWLLFQGCRDRGHDSWLAVDEKHSGDPGVLKIPPRPWARIARPVLHPERYPAGTKGRLLRVYGSNPGAFRRALLGQDSFAFPGSRRLMTLPPQPPELLHFHNLHSSYFDLRALRRYRVPLVVTMHDAWLLTGGCTHPLDCRRYLEGCGECPYRHLHFRAAIVDSTAFNHRRKRRALAGARIHLVTPCHWLMDKVAGTLLEPALASRQVIPNGVDTSIFRPGDGALARAALNVSPETRIILHASATPTRNVSKDFSTMREAVIRMARAAPKMQLLFLVVGESAADEQLSPHARVRFLPFTEKPEEMAQHYAAADMYLQASLADTFPNTILEAMACGVIPLATAVGGIPEQIIDQQTGRLFAPGPDLAERLAVGMVLLLQNDAKRRAMGTAALHHVRAHFSLDRQIDAHLALYERLLGEGRR